MRQTNYFLLIAIVGYFISRILAINYLAPHNDEVIYTQYAQWISQDWQQFKYISFEGRMGGDYKEPLQYWITSLVVNVWDNPVYGGRIVSLFMGLLAIFVSYAFISKIWNVVAANFFVTLIVLSDYFVYFDSVALAEVYLYSWGVIFLYFSYRFIEEKKWWLFVLALFFCTVLLLTKRSGLLWCTVVFIFPILLLKDLPIKDYIKEYKYNILYLYLSIIGLVGLAIFTQSFFIPEEYGIVKQKSIQSGMTRGLGEIFEFPITAWLGNLNFYFTHVLFTDYSYLSLLFIFIILFGGYDQCFVNRHNRYKFCGIVGIYFLPTMLLVVVAKIQYTRHFGISLYLFYMLLAICLAILYEKIHWPNKLHYFIAVLVVVYSWRIYYSYKPIVQFEQNNIAIAETPPGWASGIGIKKTISKISQLSPGYLFYDPQWGHPGTAIQVFSYLYPHLILYPLSPQIERQFAALLHKAKQQQLNVHIVLDARQKGERVAVDQLIENKRIWRKCEVVYKKYRGKTFTNTAIWICTKR